jgi:general secretion pathway protein G
MRNRKSSSGFTLIELIVVITLIAAVMAVVAGKVIQNKHQAEYKLAKTQLTTLSASIDQYQSDVGALPDSLQQLVTSGADDRPFSLTSLGVDGRPGGDGVDKDLVAP